MNTKVGTVTDSLRELSGSQQPPLPARDYSKYRKKEYLCFSNNRVNSVLKKIISELDTVFIISTSSTKSLLSLKPLPRKKSGWSLAQVLSLLL